MQNSVNVCPRCQAPIPPDAPGGICPGCALFAAAHPSEPDGALSGAPSLEEVATAFPELEILELIGHGGMGVVFKARQPRLDRCVALKILPLHLAAQPGFSERFTREARTLARLNHPNIVAVYDFGERGGFFHLVMEFVEGVNLREAMRAGVTPTQALALVPRLCEALQFAHDKGVLHRDIKPENILLDTSGAVKLVDFGIAKFAGDPAAAPGLTMSGSLLGTAAYMAPEQLETPATVDHRADIYSLGVVFYEMLTGELPIGRFAAPSEKSRVSHGVDEVVLRALEKERERRQQSATEMRTQVEGLKPSPRSRVNSGVPQRPWPRWKIAALITGLALPLVLIALGFIMPALAKMGVSPLWGVVAFIGMNAVLFGFILLAFALYDRLVRSGAPKWAAIAAVVAMIIVLPPMVVGVTMVTSYLSLASHARPRAERVTPGSVASVVRPEHSPFLGRFSNGSIELVSISDHSRPNDRGWQMDGNPAEEGPFENEEVRAVPPTGQRAYEFVFRARDLPADASAPKWFVQDAAMLASGAALSNAPPGEPVAGYHLLVASLPAALERVVVSAGIASGKWTTLARQRGGHGSGRTEAHKGVVVTLKHESGTEKEKGELVVTVSDSRHAEQETRVVAAIANGEEIAATRVTRMNGQSEWRFQGLTFASLAEIRFQVRPYEWVEFQDIALRPLPKSASSAPTTVLAASPGKPREPLQEEAIRLAEERLEGVRRQVEAGLAARSDMAAAQRDLAIARARGNAVSIAEARLRFAEENLAATEARLRAGVEAPAEFTAAQIALNTARAELERAQKSITGNSSLQ